MGGAPLMRFASATVRRLSARELRNSVSAIFLGGGDVDATLPAESAPHKFDNRIATLGVSTQIMDALQDYAEQVAARAVTKLASLLPCEVAKAGEQACASQFVGSYGPRVYRRPLTDTEAERIKGVFSAVRAGGGSFEDGAAAMIAALIESPNFLFRTELGGAPNADGVARLDPYEIASALSFTLWGSTPDDALLAHARDGKLDSDADVAAEAKRLIADARSTPASRNLVMQWLEVTSLTSLSRDAKTYPQWNPTLATSMQKELSGYVDAQLLAKDWTSFLTSAAATVDAPLAAVYGGSAGNVTLDATKRAGAFTRAGFLAAHLPPSGFSPAFLGRFVRQRLFCQRLPDPPADVPVLPPPSENVTTRQRFAQHDSSPNCQSCHSLMDPIGFGFERYNGVGGYAETEHGNVPLTGEGVLTATDVDGAFHGPAELQKRLAMSQQVGSCFSAHALEFAMGSDVADGSDDRDSTISAVAEGAKALGDSGKVQALLAAITATPAFLYRKTAGGEISTGGGQ